MSRRCCRPLASACFTVWRSTAAVTAARRSTIARSHARRCRRGAWAQWQLFVKHNHMRRLVVHRLLHGHGPEKVRGCYRMDGSQTGVGVACHWSLLMFMMAC